MAEPACTTTPPRRGFGRALSDGRTICSQRFWRVSVGRRSSTSLVGAPERNGCTSQAYLPVLLQHMADRPTNRIGDLAPWTLRPDQAWAT